MLTVTVAALNRLSKKLAHRKAANEVAMRFSRGDGGWKLHEDEVRAADTVFAHGGRPVLVLDKAVSEAMSGMKLDVKDTGAGPRLSLR